MRDWLVVVKVLAEDMLDSDQFKMVVDLLLLAMRGALSQLTSLAMVINTLQVLPISISHQMLLSLQINFQTVFSHGQKGTSHC